ncbi:MAG: prokaryotic E2 ligase family D protein [Bacteroidota bacterium]|nr:prokaryotic E2 ligase family D protein [Bacteroidota bacterium]
MEDSLTSWYKPAHQLVIYKGNKGAYVEHHEIINNKLSEGKPLTKKALKGMMDAVMTTDKSMFASVNQLLPENVIYYDPRPGRLKMIWYNKPQIRSVIGIYKKEVKVKVPAVLYSIDDESLSMFVLKTGAKRPEAKTPLFDSPFPNTYDDGKVCMGNVKKPNSQIEIADLIKAWEAAFWRSEFNGYIGTKNDEAALRKAIRTNTPYPSKALRATKKTINSLFK